MKNTKTLIQIFQKLDDADKIKDPNFKSLYTKFLLEWHRKLEIINTENKSILTNSLLISSDIPKQLDPFAINLSELNDDITSSPWKNHDSLETILLADTPSPLKDVETPPQEFSPMSTSEEEHLKDPIVDPIIKQELVDVEMNEITDFEEVELNDTIDFEGLGGGFSF